MNKKHLQIGLGCIAAFLFISLGVIIGKAYQVNFFANEAKQTVLEAKKLSRNAKKDMERSRTYLKQAHKYMDSITVVKTIYIKR